MRHLHDLTNILSIQHRKHGLSLFEDEDYLYLVQNGTTVEHFYHSASMKGIYEAADRYIPHAAELVGVSFGR